MCVPAPSNAAKFLLKGRYSDQQVRPAIDLSVLSENKIGTISTLQEIGDRDRDFTFLVSYMNIWAIWLDLKNIWGFKSLLSNYGSERLR